MKWSFDRPRIKSITARARPSELKSYANLYEQMIFFNVSRFNFQILWSLGSKEIQI